MKTIVATAILTLLLNAAQMSSAADVEAIMYLDTEIPCLPSETLSGRIVIRNNGDDDIKLLKREPRWSDMLVHNQLYLFLEIPEDEKGKMTDRAMTGRNMRQTIKENVDYDVQKNNSEYVVALKKGETLEVEFSDRALEGLYSIGNRHVSFEAELYLSPDSWIPVEVLPPIVVACGISYNPITAIEAGAKWDKDATLAYRVPLGTNEILLVREKSKHYRIANLCPDDVVTHINKRITITQKDGTARMIPEQDISRVSAERKEKMRKSRQLEQKLELPRDRVMP